MIFGRGIADMRRIVAGVALASGLAMGTAHADILASFDLTPFSNGLFAGVLNPAQSLSIATGSIIVQQGLVIDSISYTDGTHPQIVAGTFFYNPNGDEYHQSLPITTGTTVFNFTELPPINNIAFTFTNETQNSLIAGASFSTTLTGTVTSDPAGTWLGDTVTMNLSCTNTGDYFVSCSNPTVTVVGVAVPEPGSMTMLATFLLGVGALRRRRG